LYARFFHAMLERGVYLAPSQFETVFISSAHTEREIADTVTAAEASFAEIA
jgi:glutamate-1-semialdehyde 2,1-aminomutase